MPSISLLGQILYEWATFADKMFNYICVCSDKTVSKKTEDEILSVNLPAPATTNPDEISRRFNACAGFSVIFSTYQSLDKVSAAQEDFTFDLIICDEAHRTTGSSKDSSTQFTAIHDENFIRGKKRLYMTATPRLYTSDAKSKAAVNDITLWSMDDEKIYGEEFYRLDFGDAVEKNLLSDYKVIVLTVSGKISSDKKSADDDLPKINGCINALSKKMINVSKELAEVDPAPMHTAVAFCPKISASKIISNLFNSPDEDKKNILNVESRHVDGTQKSSERENNLIWLKNTPTTANDCRILTNVRCLSEGVDVPALDAVIFMSSKKSKVDIVQAVGRVMRKADDKKYGYIIIPVVVPLEKNPEDVLEASKTYDVIWDILNALRAHDRRVDILIEEIKFKLASGKKPDGKRIIISPGDDAGFQFSLDFGKWQDFLYARMVERVGNRRYWEQWAKDISDIAQNHIRQIKNLITLDGEPKLAFENFVEDLKKNINPSVKEEDAIDILAQHLITRPVFEALFENYYFAKENPVSESLEKILSELKIEDNVADSVQLQKFYQSVRERCHKVANSAEDKQKIIIELYDKFFKIATPLTVERLGIVYTPVEVVDFILRSVDDVLLKNFGRRLTDKGVHVIDPFAGTGTFLTRLIQSNLIQPRDMFRKYFRELHANEIVLLAYYIAAINIENAFHDAVDAKNYQPFEGICFTDTFQAYENDDNAKGQTDFKIMRSPLQVNSQRVKDQLVTQIEIIVGNPPYSVGQKSANDNNQNERYEKLSGRIAATYAAKTDATNKNSLYDSYIKAFRWASDRIDEGIIGFVTNAGWLDGAAMDGLRKCFAEEFAEIYVFNLRGNQRTQGETSRREGGKIFGSGSRAPIAITILVKNSAHKGKAEIFYKDIGDYLTREQKLERIARLNSVLSNDFKIITPNDKGDWINQRGDLFDTFIPLAPEKKFDGTAESFFVTCSNGLKTGRDYVCYNFSRKKLETNIKPYINTTNELLFVLDGFRTLGETRIEKVEKAKKSMSAGITVESFYRPFCKECLHYDKDLNQRRYQMPKFFPTGNEDNLLICVSGIGGEKSLSVFITDKITDLQFQFNGQCFPLNFYEAAAQGSLFDENLQRRDGVSDFILQRARLLYGIDVSKEDIFYYVYGFLHLPSYREKFSAELKKSLPRIILTPDAKKFWTLSRAGRDLAEIHLNYETQPAPDGVEVIGGKNFRVKKMRLSNDKTTLTYNEHLTIKNIPARSFEYVVNGRSPLEWIIDRYQIKTDKASGIVNDPNDWATEHDNLRYILDLILSSITVSLKTLDIVENLPDVEF